MVSPTDISMRDSRRLTSLISAADKAANLGLRKMGPMGNGVDNTTVDIIAIHGLGTETPRTWEFKVRGSDGNGSGSGGVVNWLADDRMLPAAVPEASIYTYGWDANCFQDAPVQSLLHCADKLLAHVAEMRRGATQRPIVFVASCFGGLVLAEALTRAAQHDSSYRDILLATVGVAFLGTPFRGSDAAAQAQWQVLVGGIMGEQTSDRLVRALNASDRELRRVTQTFAELVRSEAIQLPLCCFFETKKTELLRRFLAPRLATRLSAALGGKSQKLLVTEDSACLDTFQWKGLDTTHSGMNKFAGPEDPNFKLVRNVIRDFVDKASSVRGSRKKPEPGEGKGQAQAVHVVVPYTSNPDFIGRSGILDQLKCLLGYGQTDARRYERVALYGLGGIGKENANRLGFTHWLQQSSHEVSIFWVHASSPARFKESYTTIARTCRIPGWANPTGDVLSLVKNWLEAAENGPPWLVVVDNADDREIFFDSPQRSREEANTSPGPAAAAPLVEYLPECGHGSILITTRNKQVGVKLTRGQATIEVTEMNDAETRHLVQTKLQGLEASASDVSLLISRLESLPLALVQATAYIRENTMAVGRYLQLLDESDQNLVLLLSKEFDTVGRDSKMAHAIVATWILSFEQIMRQNRLASDLLSIMAFLDRQAIPLAFLSHYCREIRGADRNIKAKEAVELAECMMELEEALGVLKAFSFVSAGKRETLDMHRLVHLVTRTWLATKMTTGRFAEQALRVVVGMLPVAHVANWVTCSEYLPMPRPSSCPRRRTRASTAKREQTFSSVLPNFFTTKERGEMQQTSRPRRRNCGNYG